MFKAVKLTRVTIQCPEEQISPVMSVLGNMRLLHLIRIEETHLGKLGYVARVDRELLDHYTSLLTRTNRLIDGLHPTQPMPSVTKIPRPDKEIFRLKEVITRIEKEALSILEEREKTWQAIVQDQTLLDRLKLLEPAELDFDRLGSLKYATWMTGLIPEENLDRLEESLSDVYHALIPILKKDGKIVLFAMSLRDDENVLHRALKSAFWDPIELPDNLKGNIFEVTERTSRALEGLKARLSELDQQRKMLGEKYGTQLLETREIILLCSQLLKAQKKFGAIDHTYIITGWLPVDLFNELKKRIAEATMGKALIDQVDPEHIREVRSGILKIPILFNNPLLIRPFERLTTLYGTPSYKEIEPTVFLAISFLVLFGMMFGDVGQGAVLFAIGYYVFRRMFRFMDYGVILMECGVSSIIFGLLYGSVFGFEDLIPALWIHPMRHIDHFMKVSVLLGISIISLGFLLNLVNLLRQRRYGDLFSASGLAGALFYWLLAGLGIRYIFSENVSPVEVLLAKISAISLFMIMLLQRPVRSLLFHLRKGGRQRRLPKGIGITLFESLIEVLDDILRYMANTVSFVRVAAFGLTHVALFMAVFSLADMVRTAHGRGLSYWLVIVIGNLVIILLEGMVVSIQTLRLEYYEFFSRFFRGGGKPFRPLLEEKAG